MDKNNLSSKSEQPKGKIKKCPKMFQKKSPNKLSKQNFTRKIKDFYAISKLPKYIDYQGQKCSRNVKFTKILGQ